VAADTKQTNKILTMQTKPNTRKHASALIRITARDRNAELPLTVAYADILEAEADLEDAHAGVEPTIADHADAEQITSFENSKCSRSK
jgi:hypothetical protein